MRSGRVYLWGVEVVARSGRGTSGGWRWWRGQRVYLWGVVPLGVEVVARSGRVYLWGVEVVVRSGRVYLWGVEVVARSGRVYLWGWRWWRGVRGCVPLGSGGGGEGVPLGRSGEESEGVPLGGGGGGEESEGVPLGHLLRTLNLECSVLCRKRKPVSLFRKIPVNKLAEFKWAEMIAELEHDAPLLLKILHCMVAKNNSRNKCKVGAARYPGICTAVSVVLKERNREMCGLQSCLSLLMYSCHCEKQVTHNW